MGKNVRNVFFNSDRPLLLICVLLFFAYILFIQKNVIQHSQQPTVLSTQTAQFTCTMVIGYSQVGISPETISGYGEGWYVAPNHGLQFESVVDDGSWQLLWDSAHGIDQWQIPNAEGWTKWKTKEYPFFDSACVTNSASPDRILFSISGGYGSDEDALRRNIEASLTTIIQKIPSVKEIILQSVVGGPNHQTCPCTSQMQNTITACSYGPTVRASWQHAHIDNAIGRVITDVDNGTYKPGVRIVAGFSPEVRSCGDYYDSIGHLTIDGAHAIGSAIAQYYASLDRNQIPTSMLTPTSYPTNSPVPPIPSVSPTQELTDTPIPTPTFHPTQTPTNVSTSTLDPSLHPFLIPRSFKKSSECETSDGKILNLKYLRCFVSKVISRILK